MRAESSRPTCRYLPPLAQEGDDVVAESIRSDLGDNGRVVTVASRCDGHVGGLPPMDLRKV